MTASPLISLADMIRCLRELAPEDDATRAAIAALLGHELAPPPVAARGAEAEGKAEREVDEETHADGGADDGAAADHDAGKSRRADLRTRDQDAHRLAEPERNAFRPVPAGVSGTPTADLGPPPATVPEGVRSDAEEVTFGGRPLAPFDASKHNQRPAAFDPLFAPIWTRSILSAALAAPVPSRELDLPRTVRLLAERNPVEKLPRRSRPSLLNGVQVLIDLGEGMEPFRRDQFALLRRIRETVGRSQTETLYFQDCPSRGAGSRGVWSWTDYRPPAVGRPVLVLSDLLIGKVRRLAGTGLEDDWIAWALTLAQCGNPAVAFVPYPPDRWPRDLRRHLLMIPWDRTTTARTLHALLRGLPRKPQWR